MEVSGLEFLCWLPERENESLCLDNLVFGWEFVFVNQDAMIDTAFKPYNIIIIQ